MTLCNKLSCFITYSKLAYDTFYSDCLNVVIIIYNVKLPACIDSIKENQEGPARHPSHTCIHWTASSIFS